MMKPQIFIVEPKTISAKDKIALAKAGHLVIEHPSPHSVRVINPIDEVMGNDILMAAMASLTSTFPKEKFTAELAARLLKRETDGKSATPSN